MRLDENGYLGIGITDPLSKSHVADGNYAQFADNNAIPFTAFSNTLPESQQGAQ